MGTSVAYGRKDKIDEAIQSTVIPKNSIIITSDSGEGELYYYDSRGVLKTIAERRKFETFSDAEVWVKTYDCAGNIVSIHNGSDWVPYIVSDDCSLTPITSGSGSVIDIKVIDGGTAKGI